MVYGGSIRGLLELDTGGWSRAWRQASGDVGRSTKSMQTDLDRFDSSLQKVDNRQKQVAAGSRKMGLAIAAAGAGLLAGSAMFYQQAIQMAAGSEQLWNRLNVALGRNGFQVEETRKEYAHMVDVITSKTGRMRGDVVNSLADLSRVGVHNQKIMTKSSESIAGLAFVTGKEFNTIEQSYVKLISRDKIRQQTLTQIGITSNNFDKILKKHNLTMDDWANLTEDQRANLLNEASALQEAEKGNEAYSKSYEGMMNKVTQAYRSFMTSVGQELLPVLEDIGSWAIPMLQGFVSWFSQLDGRIKQIIVLAPLLVGGLMALGGVVMMLKQVTGLFGDMELSLGRLGKKKHKVEFDCDAPCPPVAGGGTGTGTGSGRDKKQTRTTSQKAARAAAGVGSIFAAGAILEPIAMYTGEGITDPTQLFAGALQGATMGAANYDWLYKRITLGQYHAKKGADENPIGKWLRDAGSKIGSGKSIFGDQPLGLMGGPGGGGLNLGAMLTKNFKWPKLPKFDLKTLVPGFDLGKQLTKGFKWPQIPKIKWPNFGDPFSGVKRFAKTLRPFITNPLNAIKTPIKNIWNTIRTQAIPIWNSLRLGIQNIGNNIRLGILNAFNKIPGPARSAWSSVKNAVKGPIDTILGLVGKLKNLIGAGGSSGMRVAAPFFTGAGPSISPIDYFFGNFRGNYGQDPNPYDIGSSTCCGDTGAGSSTLLDSVRSAPKVWPGKIIGYANRIAGKFFGVGKFNSSNLTGLWRAFTNKVFSNLGYQFYFGNRYSPREVLARGAGNCMDLARLFCSITSSFGIPCNPMGRSFVGSTPHRWAVTPFGNFDPTHFVHGGGWSVLGRPVSSGGGIGGRASAPPYSAVTGAGGMIFQLVFKGDVYGMEDFNGKVKSGAKQIIEDTLKKFGY